jgi:hypothetical protein
MLTAILGSVLLNEPLTLIFARTPNRRPAWSAAQRMPTSRCRGRGSRSIVYSPHLRALVALITTLGGGYVLMLVFKQVIDVIVPEHISSTPTFSASIETAQLGVCFSLWSLVFGLIVQPSTARSVVAGRVARTIVVARLAVVTYVVFTRFVATSVLHFPELSGRYGGDPLAFINWTILIALWHAFAFGGHLTTRAARNRRSR